MKAKSLTIALFLSLNTACSKVEQSRVSLPHAEVSSVIVDLGRIEFEQFKHAEGSFWLRNTGTAPLRILEWNVSCGCTVPQGLPKEIPPGGDDKVVLQVKPKNESGPHASSLTLVTNDPANQIVQIQVKWIELAAITVEPRIINFGRIEAGTSVEATVQVEVSTHINIPELEVTCINDAISASWANVPITQNSDVTSKKLVIRLDAPREQGLTTTEIRIATTDGTFTAALPISWKSGSNVELTPKALYHSRVEAGSEIENRLLVRSSAVGGLPVRRVEIDGQPTEFQTRGTNSDEIGVSILTFNLRAGNQVGIKEHKVLIFVGEENTDVIEIPLILSVN